MYQFHCFHVERKKYVEIRSDPDRDPVFLKMSNPDPYHFGSVTLINADLKYIFGEKKFTLFAKKSINRNQYSYSLTKILIIGNS